MKKIMADGKVKKIERALLKEYKKFWADGYVAIDSVKYDTDIKDITLKIRYGHNNPDGTVDQIGADLVFPDGSNLLFVRGMFYYLLQENEFGN